MALSNYDELKSAVADWLERSDLASRIPDFIALAEVTLNEDFRGRMNEVNVGLAATAGARTVALPADFTEAVSVWVDGCATELTFVDPALLRVQAGQGRPAFWTIEAGDLAFERPCDQAYSFTLRYLKKFQLTDAQPTNPILSAYPNLYLFGALIEAAPFIRDADLLGLFTGKYDQAMDRATDKEHANRRQSRLRTDPAVARIGRSSYDVRTG